jgi:replicative DNA helicase Mcm
MLLIGDPGTGKCQKYSTNVTLADGTEKMLGNLVESNLEDPVAVDDGVYEPVDIGVQTVTEDGAIEPGRATKVWKREAPDEMYRITMASGREVEVTPSHPLFKQSDGGLSAERADQLGEGEFVAVPGYIDANWDDSLDVPFQRVEANNANSFTPPDQINPTLARLLGYIIAEGHAHISGSSASAAITNIDEEILTDTEQCFERLGLRWSRREKHGHESAEVVRCSSLEFVRFLRELEPSILEVSAEQVVPGCLKRATPPNKAAFLRAYVDSEGTVSPKEREISVSSMSRELLVGVQTLLLAFGIQSHLERRHNDSYRLRISGRDFVKYVDEVGFITGRKTEASEAFTDVPENTNTDVVPGLGDELRQIREALALSQFDLELPRPTYQHYERGDRNPSRASLRAVVDTFESRLEWLREKRSELVDGDWQAVETLRKELNISQKMLADGMDVSQTAISYYERNEVAPDGGQTAAAESVILDRLDEALSVASDISELGELCENDVHWDRIDSIESAEPDYDWVYDLEVADTHTYLGNGVVSHNSQMLSYIKNIAPRSVYTSGKGSSSAGLTAAAVRDDFGDGQQWTLEAGALVLADQGIAAVDELDKMRCVTGDTLVHFGDRVTRIDDFARDAAESGTIEQLPNGRTVRDIDATAWTMTDDGSLVERPVTAVHEYEAPDELYRVRLETGERLTGTADHPFFVFEDGERTEKPAIDLEPDDWVYVPRQLRSTATDGGAATTVEASGNESASSPVDGETVEPTGDTGVHPSLGAVLGYLAGDGNVFYDQSEGVYGIRFINAEEQLLADFERACREAFNAEPVRPPSEQRADGVETVRLHGREYADAVLDAGMNLQTYEGKRLPEAVSRSSRATKAAFLRALADSEGTVEDRHLRVFSSSYDLLVGAKHLLLEFGITSQIQTRAQSDKRDVYVLAVTEADSLAAFSHEIGFVLDRKQAALDDAVERVTGTRTIVDVIPDCDEVLAETREALRLHQSECGIVDATYCNFETGEANLSFLKGREILDAFEERKQTAQADLGALAGDPSWETLERLRTTYHVSQSELADPTEYTQQQVSYWWGDDDELRESIQARLREMVEQAANTDLTRLRRVVYGDVKWRRVESVEPVAAREAGDGVRVQRERLATLLDCPVDDALDRGRELLRTDPDLGSWNAVRETLAEYGVSLTAVASDLDVDQSTVSRWSRGVVETDRFDDVRSAARARIDEVRAEIERLADGIEERQQPKVYDLTVEGTHNFVANGMVVHNSEDRSAMHQALEQQEISVSKAGINATLKSRCSLLGAANPKYGRFDQYEPISEQIDLEPALISRFDLIFTVTDQPNEEKDRNLADHILRTNYAGELHTHRVESNKSNFSDEEVENVTDEVAPTIEPELLRKYIAYAKRTCFPTMTEEARAEIENFYVDLRTKGTDEDAAVPVTARKLEAIVRLAEASARVRLSDTVTQDDAERVIEIVRSCMEDVGVDPETGELDADMIEAGTSKSQRDRIKNIKGLINDLEDEYDEGAPVDVVIDRAEEVGMDETKAEHEIEKLKQKGEVYEPQTDYLRTT